MTYEGHSRPRVEIKAGRDIHVGDSINGRKVLSFNAMRDHPALGPCREAVLPSECTKSRTIGMAIFDDYRVAVDVIEETKR